jgi:ABC-type multidrug transport system fused ATPase/permease subunit
VPRTKQTRRPFHLYSEALTGVKRRSALAVAVAGLSGCAEALGLVSLTPLLDDGDTRWDSIWPVLLLIAGFLILATVLKLASDQLIGSVTTRVESRLRRQLTERLVFAPWTSVGKLSQGEITSAVMSESTQVSNGVYALLNGGGNALVVLVLATSAAVLTPSLLGVAVLFVLLSALIFRSRLKHVRDNERLISEATGEVGEDISSALGDLKYLRESGSDREWLVRAWESAETLAHLRRRQIALPAVTRTMVDSLGAVFLALVVALGIILLDSVTLGIVFVALFYRITPRVQVAQTMFNTAFGQVSWILRWNERMTSLGGAPPDLDVSRIAPKSSIDSTDDRAPTVEMLNVHHSYNGRSEAVLKNVSFKVESGSKVAIIGESGAGKSTILDLVLGLFEPMAGSVLIDGRQFSEQEWRDFRRSVGVVPQEVPLRRGTIADNIRWDRALDDERISEAIQMAELSSLVDSAEHGVDTFIESRTIGLSGGQRQRIGLARALYRRPKLLILDEATSALDSSTEAKLLETLARITREVTVICVSHRLTVLDFMDRTIEVHQGALVEGTS